MIAAPAPPATTELPFDHLAAMSDDIGLFEHAEFDVPRRAHGYCLDDVARGLSVAVRDGGRSPHSAALVETYLRFVEEAVVDDGSARNRRDEHGRWTDAPALGDWWGRAVQALGFTAATASSPRIRDRALAVFERAARRRSTHLRSMMTAVIGASEVLLAGHDSPAARALVRDGIECIPAARDPRWPWPEQRLTYGNATIAEALLAAGAALDQPVVTARGLSALTFLLVVETRDGHLSVTGTAGRGPADLAAQFDQQPIEVAALADASARAARFGLGEHWPRATRLARQWFLGENDAGVAMVDLASGAGYDGLHRTGRNENRGAESTLAAISTFQHADPSAADR